ncbi:MAG: hydroxymethylglutaryl-CoA lyase [Thiothrix sp.]|nr:hydroxymethylglutaryl-CoA lyase [Thiothrix sp.]HPE59026.1 hydroxymethylglutaryl-CoA lyase [Thiolinea sp.]
MALPQRVKIVEVGPRDGLQNEPEPVPVEVRIGLIERLQAAGVSVIEVGSFVSPKWVPQMANSAAVFRGIRQQPGVSYPVLVPNLTGLDAALAAGVQEIAVFTAASETFSQANTHCSITEGLERCAAVIHKAHAHGLRVRGYVSCVLGCPYEDDIDTGMVADVARQLHALGCHEISLGDTIGIGTPLKAQALVERVSQQVPLQNLAVHFHDTYGQALANIHAVLQQGITVVDSSVGGLGGCPYAKGASGNVATEDVLYLLDGLGIETGIDLELLLETGRYISTALGREPASKLGRVHAARINRNVPATP